MPKVAASIPRFPFIFLPREKWNGASQRVFTEAGRELGDGLMKAQNSPQLTHASSVPPPAQTQPPWDHKNPANPTASTRSPISDFRRLHSRLARHEWNLSFRTSHLTAL